MSSVSDIKYQAWHASSVTCVLPHKPKILGFIPTIVSAISNKYEPNNEKTKKWLKGRKSLAKMQISCFKY